MAKTEKAAERWQLTHESHEHVVEIRDVGLRRSITWLCDGTEIAKKMSSEERVVLDGAGRGAVGVRLPKFVGPARRVTWYPPDGEPGAQTAARAGLGGVDLDPESGSRAAAREAWIRAHPRRYAARRTVAAALGVLLPLCGLWLLARIAIPWPHISIPWPDWDLPSIPWPSIPWPDITLPRPHWHLPELPAWMRALLEKAKYVWPVVLAYVLARVEVRRRRVQDERKRRAGDVRRGPDRTTSASPPAFGSQKTSANHTGGDDHPTGRPQGSP